MTCEGLGGKGVLGKEGRERVRGIEVRRLILNASNKQCSLNPIPTWLLKECVSDIVPFLVDLFNRTLSSTGEMPRALKKAIITPILKKPNLEKDDLSNYRPMSNLPFISKTLEKVVASRLTKYLEIVGDRTLSHLKSMQKFCFWYQLTGMGIRNIFGPSVKLVLRIFGNKIFGGILLFAYSKYFHKSENFQHFSRLTGVACYNFYMFKFVCMSMQSFKIVFFVRCFRSLLTEMAGLTEWKLCILCQRESEEGLV